MNNFKRLAEGSGIMWSMKDSKEVNTAVKHVDSAMKIIAKVYKRTEDSDLKDIISNLGEMIFKMQTVGD